MSAERLREAAALMRERAAVGSESDYPPPWSVGVDPVNTNQFEVLCHEDGSGLVADDLDREVADYIASWHPAVALAVADLLEVTSCTCEPCGCCGARITCDGCEPTTAALAVANAYLGTP